MIKLDKRMQLKKGNVRDRLKSKMRLVEEQKKMSTNQSCS